MRHSLWKSLWAAFRCLLRTCEGESMIYVLLFLIVIGIVLNAVSRENADRGLSYSLTVSKKLVEIDEPFQISTAVENRKILPVTYLQVTEKFPNALKYAVETNVFRAIDFLYHTTTMMLMPYQRVRRTYEVSSGHRGRITLQNVTLNVGDLLGFSTVENSLELGMEVVVPPRAADLTRELTPLGDYYGDFSVRRWMIDDPVLTVGVREYTGVEPLKTIHWPSSLRSGRLMVRQFDYTSDNTVMVVLNTECVKPAYNGADGKAIEWCLSAARGVVEQLEEAGIPYGFAADSSYAGDFEATESAAPGYGAAHYANILESLGRVTYYIDMPFEKLLEELQKGMGRYTTFVLITPSVLEPYVAPINKLAEEAAGLAVIARNPQRMENLNEPILKYAQGGENA